MKTEPPERAIAKTILPIAHNQFPNYCRPFHGLRLKCLPCPWGSRPSLYASACSASSLKRANRSELESNLVNLSEKQKVVGFLHRGLVRVIFVGLPLVLLSGTALAHAKLERSEPKNNSTLQQAPQLVELWFSEELESGFNSIEVKDQHGKRFDQGGVTLSEGNKKAQIALEALGAGTYTVVWKVLSMDQHTLRGEFTFTVAQGVAPKAATASSPHGLGSPAMDSMPMEKSEAGFEIYPDLSAVRWLNYLAMMMLFGGFAMYLLVLAPALRGASLEEPSREAQIRNVNGRRIVKWSWVGLLLLLLTSSVSLVFKPQEFSTSLWRSRYRLRCWARSFLARAMVATGFWKFFH